MPVPLAVAGPLAAASLAYLNAKTSFSYDMVLLKAHLSMYYHVIKLVRQDRLNLFYTLESRAQSSLGGKDLLLFDGKSYSYRDVYDKALRYGYWLKTKYNVKPREIIAINFQNSDTFIFLWWALWSIGAYPAFINYNLTGAPLIHCVKAATSRLCLVDPGVAGNITPTVQDELKNVEFVVFGPELEAEASIADPVRAPDEDRAGAEPFGMAILIFTSGTTGLPKPAVVSWGKCTAGSNVVQYLLDRGNDDILYTSMPLYHSSASVLGFCCTVWSGSTQAIGRKFSTKVFWKEVRESKATLIQYVGETLRYLLAAPPQIDAATGEDLDRKHHVRIAFGNGLRPDIWDKFKARFGVETVVEFYAATEGSFATWNVSRNSLTAGAVGKLGLLYGAWVSRSVALVEVDHATDAPWRDPMSGYCKKVQSGEPGEMLFKLAPDDIQRNFQGYYGNKAASEAKILRDVFWKGDAWYRTGDMVRWDNEGRVYFHDRIGDTFRWKSENVSTAEVSEAMGRHPIVQEANVYGVQLPHHDGRAGCAALSLDRDPDEKTLRSLAAHVRSSLPRYAQPLFFRITKTTDGISTQITGTNKQQKHLLRQAGVEPSAKDAEMGSLYWLGKDTYLPFQEADWRALNSGQVKL